MPVQLLTIDHLALAHQELTRLFEADPEPIPAWASGERDKLEMMCSCTEVEAFGVEKYPDIVSKTAKLFYSAIKLHPFPNGNKRFALIATLSFIIINDHRLKAEVGSAASLATYVATTDPHTPGGEPDRVITQRVRPYFEEGLEPYAWRAATDPAREESD